MRCVLCEAFFAAVCAASFHWHLTPIVDCRRHRELGSVSLYTVLPSICSPISYLTRKLGRNGGPHGNNTLDAVHCAPLRRNRYSVLMQNRKDRLGEGKRASPQRRDKRKHDGQPAQHTWLASTPSGGAVLRIPSSLLPLLPIVWPFLGFSGPAARKTGFLACPLACPRFFLLVLTMCESMRRSLRGVRLHSEEAIQCQSAGALVASSMLPSTLLP